MNMSKPTTASPWVDWSPWTVKGDRRVVASERAWRMPKAASRKAVLYPDECAKCGVRLHAVAQEMCGETRCPSRHDAKGKFTPSLPKCGGEILRGVRPRIRVVPDLFEDWTGPMEDAKGNILISRHVPPTHGMAGLTDHMSLADVRRRVFGLIDATPNVDWLVSTAWPERVAGMMPPQGIGDFRDSDTVCTISLEPRPNLWLGARISTQAEADARIPCLLRLPAARRWLDVSPTEVLGIGDYLKSPWMPDRIVEPGSMPIKYIPVVGVDWVRIAADAHPDAARSLAEQCRAAGVPCWHEGDENVRETP